MNTIFDFNTCNNWRDLQVKYDQHAAEIANTTGGDTYRALIDRLSEEMTIRVSELLTDENERIN